MRARSRRGGCVSSTPPPCGARAEGWWTLSRSSLSPTHPRVRGPALAARLLPPLLPGRLLLDALLDGRGRVVGAADAARELDERRGDDSPVREILVRELGDEVADRFLGVEAGERLAGCSLELGRDVLV